MMKFLILFTILLYAGSLQSENVTYNVADPNLQQFVTKPGESQATNYNNIYTWVLKHSSETRVNPKRPYRMGVLDR